VINLEDDGNCFVCGQSNRDGLRVEFKKTDNGVTARFSADSRYQGYRGIVHGGIIASLLDEASVKALVVRGIKAVTADISLRYKAPLFINEDVVIHAVIGKIRGKMYEVDAEMMKTDGEVVARSRAKLLYHGD
jgi:acyl-coenzyme A thioesterase PaaI-like protein